MDTGRGAVSSNPICPGCRRSTGAGATRCALCSVSYHPSCLAVAGCVRPECGVRPRTAARPRPSALRAVPGSGPTARPGARRPLNTDSVRTVHPTSGTTELQHALALAFVGLLVILVNLGPVLLGGLSLGAARGSASEPFAGLIGLVGVIVGGCGLAGALAGLLTVFQAGPCWSSTVLFRVCWMGYVAVALPFGSLSLVGLGVLVLALAHVAGCIHPDGAGSGQTIAQGLNGVIAIGSGIALLAATRVFPGLQPLIMFATVASLGGFYLVSRRLSELSTGGMRTLL
jgi:hypothetical protein